MRPVTNPVLLTLALLGDPETHGLIGSGVPVPLNCVVEFTPQIVRVPEMVGVVHVFVPTVNKPVFVKNVLF